jgi:hypothetical protein
VDPAGTEALREAIRHLHGCESVWVESVSVIETFRGEMVWDGEAQVFELVAQATAKRAYEWSCATEGTKRKFVAVLHAGPVTDAVTAVRASIAAR